jgi:hypothetical protein
MARGSLLDKDGCGVVVDLVAGPSHASRVGGLGGAYLADELAGPSRGQDGKEPLLVAELEGFHGPGSAIGEQRCLLEVLEGQVAGDGVGDDGGVSGGDLVASGHVAGGEFGLFHAHQCLGFFRGPASRTLLGFRRRGGCL